MRSLSVGTLSFWFVLAVPAVYLVVEKIVTGIPGGKFFAVTGSISVWLMFVTLAQTPFERLFPKQAWIRRLRPYRRHIGVASFTYAALHTLYWLQAVDMARIMESFTDPVLYTGWLPFFAMGAMAVTSNDLSVRKMGPGWKTLQRLIYVGAPLVVLHWFVSVLFRESTVMIYGGLLALWIVLRLYTGRIRWRSAG